LRFADGDVWRRLLRCVVLQLDSDARAFEPHVLRLQGVNASAMEQLSALKQSSH
jgi:hypothetical protein